MSIYDFTLDELENYLVDNGFKKYNATQIFEGIYKKRVSSFDEITNISKELKAFLNNNFEIKYLKVLDELKSEDTNKYLLEVKDSSIEVVLMKHDYGNSICISTQIGCNMACAFCESGRLKKIRNLETYEMVQQIILISKYINQRIDSCVIMGIGEPFDNYDNVINFIRIINDPKALNIGARHITVSTCGIVPKIKEFSSLDLQVNLAISLHAPNDKIRNEIMPISKAYNLNELMDVLDYYYEKTLRRITFEYVLLSGINDSKENAIELANLIKGKNAYVNLINYNETKNIDFKESKKINEFYDILKKNGIDVTVRRKFGNKISAACGQLRSKEV